MALLFQWTNYHSIDHDTVDIQATLPSMHCKRQHDYSQQIAYCVCSSGINQCSRYQCCVVTESFINTWAINTNQCYSRSLQHRLDQKTYTQFHRVLYLLVVLTRQTTGQLNWNVPRSPRCSHRLHNFWVLAHLTLYLQNY